MENKKEEILNSESSKAPAKKFKLKFSFKFLNKIIFSLAIFSLVYYVAGINDLIAKGFRLQELRIESVRLQEENRNIKSKAVALESYQNLNERARQLNMIAMGEEVHYISSISEGSVVAKR